MHFKVEERLSFGVVGLDGQPNLLDSHFEQGNRYVIRVKHYLGSEGMTNYGSVVIRYRVERVFQVLKRNAEGSMRSVVNAHLGGRYADLVVVLLDENDGINLIAL